MAIRTRDLILLPLLGIATAIALLAIGEFTARLLMPEELADACAVKRADGVHFRPGCVSHIKAAEGPDTVMRYNECGYRSDHSCRSKPMGGFRIAVLGSSMSQGFTAPYEETYARRVERSLGRRCGRPVDVQPIPTTWPKSPDDPLGPVMRDHARAALALKPDAALFFVTTYDLANFNPSASMRPAMRPAIAAPERTSPGWYRFLADTMGSIYSLRDTSRLVLAMRHLLYRNDRAYLERHLARGDEAGYLHAPLSAGWEARLAMTERSLLPTGEAAARAGIPFALVYVPFDQDVILSREPEERPGIDRSLFRRRLAAMAAKHGWLFIDSLPAFSADTPQHSNYFRVNAHVNGPGGQHIANAIVTGLDASGALRNCGR